MYRRRRKTRRADSVQWFTPIQHYDRGRELAGLAPDQNFDVDPATHPQSPIYSLVYECFCGQVAGDDGLVEEWHGNVWLNPPYGRVIEEWITKAILERYRDPTRAICMLVPAKSDTRWWHKAKAAGFVSHEIAGRIRFLELTPDGELELGGAGKFPSAYLVYVPPAGLTAG